MKIAIDAFGGDNAPLEPIKGAAMAVAEIPEVEVILVGDEKKIRQIMTENGVSEGRITIENAEGVISISDNAAEITRSKKNSSMGTAFQIVADNKADAFISAGSTAALVVGGSLITRRIRGVKRPTLSTVMPSINGRYLLSDSGSNVDCRPEMLLQFAIMNKVYAEKILKIKNPRIGLLNIGSEEEKGRILEKETYPLLKNSGLNFVGNVEGRDATLGNCDVLITDGFTGNVYLKTVEGMGKFMKHSLTDIFSEGTRTKIAYLAVRNGVKNVSKKTDYRETGGTPLLGCAKPVFKAHGSSDALAFKNAIRAAAEFVQNRVNELLLEELEKN